jgi:multidrug efflux system outer membrane protein
MRHILILLLAALPQAVSAAEIPSELTLQDCVTIALKNNPALSAQRNTMEQAKYSYLAGLNVLYPQVGLSHSFNRSGGQNSASSSWAAGISASENLFNLKAYSTVRSSKLGYEKAEEDYLNQSAALRQTLADAYLALIYAQANLKAQQQIYKIRDDNAKLIELHYNSGVESRGNMMYADALAAQAKSSVAQADRAVDSARRSLLTAMGTADYVKVSAKDDLTLPDFALDIAGLRAKIEDIPQVRSQEKSLAVLKEKLLQAKFDAAPTLTASQSLGWNGSSEFPANRAWSFGFNLSLPLFSNGLTYYSENNKAASSALKSGEDSLRSLKVGLENSLVGSYYDFLNARDSAQSVAAVLKANEERYKESQIFYMAGQISFIDLETIEQNLVDSQLNQLSQLKNAGTAKISLENLLGVGL